MSGKRQWYLLIQGYDPDTPDAFEALHRGLEKIRLDADSEATAEQEARIIWEDRQRLGVFTEHDGVRYPHPVRLVETVELDWAQAPTLTPEPTFPTYHLTVDYSLPLAEAIARCGFNGYVNQDITLDHFSRGRIGTAQITLALVHLDLAATTAQILAYMEENNLRPATIEELLALAEKHPNLQMGFPIISLGSVWWPLRGGCGTPYLSRNAAGRELHLSWFGPAGHWGESCRFAAVSKPA